jgi:hypothetical protein
MMQMLAAGGLEPLCDDARPPDADNPHGYYEFEAVKRIRRDTRWLSDAVGRVVKVVQPLVTELPDGYAYRLVRMRRPLEEVLASQREMLLRLGGDADDLPPERWFAIFRHQDRALERWLDARGAARVLVVDYRDAVSDPGATARKLDPFLGGKLDCEAMCRVVDRGLYRRKSGPPG